MKILLLSVFTLLSVSCSTVASNYSSRSAASNDDELVSTTDQNTEASDEHYISPDVACNSHFSQAPLEIKINRAEDTLSLYRGEKLVEGYPILALSSGFPNVKAQSPKEMKDKNWDYLPKHGGRPAEFKSVFYFGPKGHFMAESNDATFDEWSKEKRAAYKKRNSGNIAVSPQDMKTLFACASQFPLDQIKITVK